mmetsp:Transcript_74757/g.188220  ORF Transcript_74757/g.188220 Transcript_74757/m.188220 type:complete len:233 (-) Transcript_74757:27-725(-)
MEKYKPPHQLIVDAVHLECNGADSCSDHLVSIVEKPGRLHIEVKGGLWVLQEKEFHGLLIQAHRQGFYECDVEGQDLLVFKVQWSLDQSVDVVVAEKVIHRRLVSNVQHQYGQCLQQLELDGRGRFRKSDDFDKVGQNILLAEKVEKVGVVLFAPDEHLSDLPNGLDDFYHLVATLFQVALPELGQPIVELLQSSERIRVLTAGSACTSARRNTSACGSAKKILQDACHARP